MTTVDVSESLTYGFKLFWYLLVVAVLGGGGMALGGALAGPIVLDGAVTEELSSPELLGGAVLGVLGLAVWVTGTFGLIYKLLADAVSRGVPKELDFAPAEAEAPNQQQNTQPATEPVGPSPGEQTARSFGPEPTVPGAADVPDRATAQSDSASPSDESAGEDRADTGSDPAVDDGSLGTEERTAEEIAFGDRNEESDRQPPTDDSVAAETEPTPHTDSQPADPGEQADRATATADAVEEESDHSAAETGGPDGENADGGAGAAEQTDAFPTDDRSVNGPAPDDSGADELFSSDADEPDSTTEPQGDSSDHEATDETNNSSDNTGASDTDPLA